MKYTEGTAGRVFILRLEEGEMLNDTVEAFARSKGVTRAFVSFLGGSADGSRVVVGPDAASPDAIVPLVHRLPGHREVLALGTLIPNEEGSPVLHMHAAAGREGDAIVGCTRAGLEVWLVGEVVIQEIVGAAAERRLDPATGFELLHAGAGLGEPPAAGAAAGAGVGSVPDRMPGGAARAQADRGGGEA